MGFYTTKELIDLVFGVTVPGPIDREKAINNNLTTESQNTGTYIDPNTFFTPPGGKVSKSPIGIFNSKKPENWTKKVENQQKQAKNTIIKTGFSELDSLLGNLDSDSLTLIAGLPGVGKTSLALNIAEEVAAATSTPVAFFSLEIEREELLTRLVSAHSQVTLDSIYSGFITSEERKDLNTALEDLYHAPLHIDTDMGHSLSTIREQIEYCKDRLGIKLIIIDCMQIIKNENKKDKSLRKVGSELKALARELSIPIIATYQLPQSWQNKKVVPHPSFILRQGAAEHYSANKIILIYRRGICRECDCQIELCTCDLDLDTRLVVATGSSQKGVAHLRFISSSVHFETPPAIEKATTGNSVAKITINPNK